MSRIDETIQAKKDKRSSLERAGILAHAYSFDKQHTIAACRASEGTPVQTAGRLFSIRTHGKVTFADLTDETGTIQIMLTKSQLGEWFDRFSFIDAGDFIGVAGQVTTTKTGELTIQVESMEFLGKALRPLPTAWNAAETKEARFRQRYLDMLINPETKRVLDARWLIIKEVRRYLQDEHNFTEVDTPILQPLYGGTNAKPFHTHMNALDCDFYLRLAPELYLKRLVVGGYDKIFEIARNFRNEGIDQTHQPEFTMIEWYEAYADYQRMMDVAEGLLKHLVKKLNGSYRLQVHDQTVDVGSNWPRITMVDALKKFVNIDFNDLSDRELQALLATHQITIIGEFTRGKAQFALFDKLVTGFLIQPTWIIDYPRDVSPLAKEHRLHPHLAERYECYIGGKELADGWSEITDSIDQRAIFENEQQRMRAGDDEAHPVDEEYLTAMEYGMPPLGGIGMGIDRLVMFLTNTWSIKEVIAFPTLRPLLQQQPKTAPKQAETVTANKREHSSKPLPARQESMKLLNTYIKNDRLRHHCLMVADAMAAYAKKLGEDEELWYQSGLLHDLDWELYPDEHPNKAISDILTEYPQALLDAIAAHAPERTGKHPETTLEKHLFACDEISGFMHAVSLLRPNGFADMKPSSVKKKLKDTAFAATVNRADITESVDLIQSTLEDHLQFLIEVFNTATTDAHV